MIRNSLLKENSGLTITLEKAAIDMLYFYSL